MPTVESSNPLFIVLLQNRLRYSMFQSPLQLQFIFVLSKDMALGIIHSSLLHTLTLQPIKEAIYYYRRFNCSPKPKRKITPTSRQIRDHNEFFLLLIHSVMISTASLSFIETGKGNTLRKVLIKIICLPSF